MATDSRKPNPLGTGGLVLVSEPMEAAFTLLLPEGWTNSVHLQREHDLNRAIASSIRPDGGAMFHVGDPRLPMFMAPGPHVDPQTLAFTPHIRVQPYTPADRFFVDYAHRFFGAAPGFRLLGAAPSPEFLRIAGEIRRHDPSADVTAAAVTFEHSGAGRPMTCRVHGSTVRVGWIWLVELIIASTVEEIDPLDAVALRIMTSRTTSPAWLAGQQRLREQRMAMGRQQVQHINAMADLQARGHHQRMQDIHDFGAANTRMHEQRMAGHDASHQSWMAAQSASDGSHRAWMDGQAADDAMQRSRINAIREEHTVMDSDGRTYQVDIHHDRYFVNPRDNTYIGVGAATDREDLRRTHGVNPDDFEEVRIVR
jgi:hypothetical protein